MRMSNSFSYQVLAPALLGFFVGLANLVGCDDFVLSKLDYWLHDNPLGTFMLGLYLMILGAVGIAGFFTDTEKLKSRFREISVVKWYSKIAGLLSGLTISTVIFGRIAEMILLGFYSGALFMITWLFWTFEQMVFAEVADEDKKKWVSGVAAISSLLLGMFSFYLAWQDSLS